MTMGISAGISRQRGFWLRCFLGLAFLCAAACGVLRSQVEFDKTEHIAKAEGLVVNSEGKPVTHVEVTLNQDGKPVYTTRTDDSGAFGFDHASGRYTFHVARTAEYAPAVLDVVVNFEIASSVQRKKLYVIVGPGACEDACSSVFTSKSDFKKAIKKKNRH
jgi:hypothetical protein